MVAERVEQNQAKPRDAYIAESRQRKATEGDILSRNGGGLLEKANIFISGNSDLPISEVSNKRLAMLATEFAPTLEYGIWSRIEAQYITSSIRGIIRTLDGEASLLNPIIQNEQYTAIINTRQEWSRMQTKYRRTMKNLLKSGPRNPFKNHSKEETSNG